jgi:inorganic pyrophosphatase
MERLEDISQPLRDEISHFFSIYKQPEGKEVEVEGWFPREQALEEIDQARRRFADRSS